MPNVTRLSVFSPRSTRLTLSRLLVNRPADDQQRHRQRDLRRGERRAEPRRAARAGRLARLALQRRQPDRAACCGAPGTGRTAGRCRASAPPRTASTDRVELRRATCSAASSGSIDAIRRERPLRDQQAGERRRAPRAAATRSSSCAISCRGSRRSTAAPPSRRRASPRAPAAGWRCSRRRSAARAPVTPSSRISGVLASPCTELCPAAPAHLQRPSPGTAPSSARSCPSAAAPRRR